MSLGLKKRYRAQKRPSEGLIELNGPLPTLRFSAKIVLNNTETLYIILVYIHIYIYTYIHIYSAFTRRTIYMCPSV